MPNPPAVINFTISKNARSWSRQGIFSIGIIKDDVFNVIFLPNSPEGWFLTKSVCEILFLKVNIEARASPIAIATAVLAVGARFKGHASLSTDPSSRASLNLLIVEVFSPNHSRTFCFYTDAIEIIKKLTLNSKIPKDIYNIGNPKNETKIRNLSFKISNFLKSKKKIKFVEDSHNSPSRRLPDMSKTNKFIKKTNYKNIEYGIEKTYLSIKFKWR